MFNFVKRIFLFGLVNILIIASISVVWAFLSQALNLPPQTYAALIFYCVVFGFGGALISLALSRVMAKWMMGVKIIDPQFAVGDEKTVLHMVTALAQKAGLPETPEVGIYESDEVNAFATGPSKRRSLVAVSTGLLRRMNSDQVEGVLGHEIGHIANGDMVTMTLIQGVINSVVMIIARVIAMAVASATEERNRYWVQFSLVMILQFALGLLGTIAVSYFSRRREFRADAWGARLAGKDRMISALRALGGTTELVDESHPALASLKISGANQNAFVRLFSTHPPLEERITALQKAATT